LKTTGSDEGFAYQWYRNDMIIPTAVANMYPAMEPGVYKVMVTSAAGCGNFTNPVEIYNSCKEGINSSPDNLVVYPNPAGGDVHIALTGMHGDAIIRITDMSGNLVMAQSLYVEDQFEFVWETGNYSAGLYFIQVVTKQSDYRQTVELIR
jgi:hypothetical protein